MQRQSEEMASRSALDCNVEIVERNAQSKDENVEVDVEVVNVDVDDWNVSDQIDSVKDDEEKKSVVDFG